MSRLPYPLGLILSARRCDIDAPRTPYAAARERSQLGIALLVKRGRTYLVRNIGPEALAIVANQRSWG